MVALLYTGGATIFGGNDNKDWSKGISRKSMCLSIDLCKSEQKVFNI